MQDRSHILIVEDDLLVCELLSAALEDTFNTTIVGTSQEALDRLRLGGVHLMLLDCTLPDGVQDGLLPEADERGVPVVLMSGDPARMAAITNRSRPFVVKPFTIGGLIDTVESTLAARAPAA